MEDVAELVADYDTALREAQAGQAVTFGPPPPRACPTCPWRVSNGARPPLDAPRHTPAEYYSAEGRAAMWADWDGEGHGLADGVRAGCHLRRDMTEWRWCAGGDGIQMRELVRWWQSGRSATDFAPLSGPDAIRRILAATVGIPVVDADDGTVITDNLELRRAGDQLQPELYGQPLPLELIVDLAHPAVLDPDAGCEFTAPPAPGEFDGLDVGAGWADNGGKWQTVAPGR